MELRFLGTGAAFAPLMGNTGAFFAIGDNLYLIDCGEQAFMKLMRAKLFEQYKGRITVILTHMHADHCGSLGTLCLYAHGVLERPLTIIHPNEDVRTLLALNGANPSQYTLLSSLETADLTVEPISARHVPAIPAYSYFITDETGRYYYSGDNGELPQAAYDGLLDGSITHAYIDVNTFISTPAAPPHLPYQILVERMPAALRKRCTLMHFNGDFRRQIEQDSFLCAMMDPVFG